MREVYKNITHCRICRSKSLTEVLRIKPQYISSNVVKTNENEPLAKIKIPMTLLQCRKCGLVQLKETTHPNLLFQNYFYRSSVNKTMRNNLRDVVRDVISKTGFKRGDHVVDIGCNDAVMLSYFPKRLGRIGVEPAKNIDWSHLDPSIKIINDYFSKDDVLKVTKGKKVKAATAIAMFYDLDNPNTVATEIKEILAPDGVCCIQVSHLHVTVRDANFYDICHEHLEYYSLKTLNQLMEKNGLSIFDASMNGANGGSLRIFATHSENKRARSSNVDRIYEMEDDMKLDKPIAFKAFRKRAKYLARWLKDFLIEEIERGGFVIGLGASTKGNVVIQLCGIDNKILPYISDRNKSKVGMRTLGTDIEIISEAKARKMNPSLMLVSPWYFRDEILDREKDYLKRGGKLLFVMPYPHIVDKKGEVKLKV